MSSISWSTYWMCIATCVCLYYLYVCIAYFREEIAGILKGGLPAKKKKNPASIPSSNKESILGSYGALETQQEQELEPAELDQDTQEDPAENWQPAPPSNAQYAAAGFYEGKPEQTPSPFSAVVTSAAVVPIEDPFSDIPLEENKSEESILQTISLSAMPAKKIDVDMFFSFMEQYTPDEQVHTLDEQKWAGRGEIEINVEPQEREEEITDNTFNNPVF